MILPNECFESARFPDGRKRGAQPGNRNALKHGGRTREACAFRRRVREHLHALRALDELARAEIRLRGPRKVRAIVEFVTPQRPTILPKNVMARKSGPPSCLPRRSEAKTGRITEIARSKTRSTPPGWPAFAGHDS